MTTEEGNKTTVTLMPGEINISSISFTCEIYGEPQIIYLYSNPLFQICDQCKKDIRELVVKKRERNESCYVTD